VGHETDRGKNETYLIKLRLDFQNHSTTPKESRRHAQLVIADPKVVTAFNETHIAQMLGYLNITGLKLAILLNFKNSKLDWKRVVN